MTITNQLDKTSAKDSTKCSSRLQRWTECNLKGKVNKHNSHKGNWERNPVLHTSMFAPSKRQVLMDNSFLRTKLSCFEIGLIVQIWSFNKMTPTDYLNSTPKDMDWACSCDEPSYMILAFVFHSLGGTNRWNVTYTCDKHPNNVVSIDNFHRKAKAGVTLEKV